MVAFSGFDARRLNHVPDSTLDLTNNIIYRDEYRHPAAEGGQSDIYRADIHGIPIAVKVMREIGVDSDQLRGRLAQKIAREMKVWSKVTHENVLAFLGFCFFPNISHTGSSAQLSLVSPWMKNGTAVQFARANPTVDRLPIIRGVVDGLRHLHEKNIVHGDIKGGNVFISDDGVPVLADFGLATWIENDRSLGPSHEAITSTTTASLRGTPRWIAPELLLSETSKSSSESDIWALGCFFLELITLAMPYPYCRTDINAVSAIMQRRLPYEFPSPSPAVPGPFERYSALWPVCLRCWEHDVSRRIRVGDIVEHAALRPPPRTRISPVIEPARPVPQAPSVAPTPAPIAPRSDRIPSPALLAPAIDAGSFRNPEVLAMEAKVRIKKRSLGEEDPETLDNMHELSLMYHKNRQFHDAEVTETTVLEARKRILGEYHPATLASMHHLASTYYAQYKYDESERLGRETYEAAKLIHGEDNPSTLTTMYNLAMTYQSMRQFSNSEEWYSRCFRGRKALLGPDDENTLRAMHELMLVTGELDRLTTAAELGVDLVERRRRILGDSDTDTRQSMEELMVTLIKIGRIEEAEALELVLSRPI